MPPAPAGFPLTVLGDGESHYLPCALSAFGVPWSTSWWLTEQGHGLTNCWKWVLISGKAPPSSFLIQVCSGSFFFSNQVTAEGNLTVFLPCSRQKLAPLDTQLVRVFWGVGGRAQCAGSQGCSLVSCFPSLPPSSVPLSQSLMCGVCRNNYELHEEFVNNLTLHMLK